MTNRDLVAAPLRAGERPGRPGSRPPPSASAGRGGRAGRVPGRARRRRPARRRTPRPPVCRPRPRSPTGARRPPGRPAGPASGRRPGDDGGASRPDRREWGCRTKLSSHNIMTCASCHDITTYVGTRPAGSRLLRPFPFTSLFRPPLRPFFSYSGGRRGVADEKRRSGRPGAAAPAGILASGHPDRGLDAVDDALSTVGASGSPAVSARGRRRGRENAGVAGQPGHEGTRARATIWSSPPPAPRLVP